MSIAKAMLIATTLLAVSCEQTVDVELPYQKQLVVNTFVGNPAQEYAWISRTIPIDEELTVENSFANNAVVQIHWRDTTYNLPVSFTHHGYLLPLADERWHGDSMRMTVDWEGLHTEATARMPTVAQSVSIHWVPYHDEPTYGVLTAHVVCESGVVFWVAANAREYGIASSPMQFYGNYETIPNVGNHDVVERSYFITSMSREEALGYDSISVDASVADIDYERFLVQPFSRRDGPFGFGGVNPYFNIKGDGLGLFIPTAVYSKRLKIIIR